MSLPFIPNAAELRPFAAELWLIATIVAVLLAPFFTPRKSNGICGIVTLAGLGAGLVTLLFVGPAAGESVNRLRPMLVADGVAYYWKALLLLFTIGVVLMWFSTTAREMHEGDGPEFFTLLLGATLGMALMGSAANLLMVFVAIETASLPSYVLAGFRKTHRVGAEASLKYVLFGAAASSIMVYGMSFLYGLYGTLRVYGTEIDGRHVAGLAEAVAHSTGGGALLAVAVFGLIVGIGFKISAVPFHFWCPDVFEGAGIDVSAFLSVASKGAGLVLLLRLLVAIGAAQGFEPTPGLMGIAAVIGALGALTATVGNLSAFAQNNIKRLLAYSSIAHAGYMLCAVSLLVRNKPGVDPASQAGPALLVYLAVYMIMNLGAFTVAGLVYRKTAGEDLSTYAGLGRRSPLLAACMAMCLVSLIGLPPLAGFTAKFNVMAVLGSNGGWWWLLVAAIGVNTVLSLYYYARVIRLMYMADSDEPAFTPPPVGAALSVACAAILVVMLVASGPLLRSAAKLGRLEGTPAGVSAAAADPTSVSAAR
ncbi:MAG: NADH-quinone oxidoreductase subunit [Phycisphaerales bacterium]|nr:NADH-quinone oxidoreductase subunit [Phycisphaerales bacterium]MDB5354158.1 NADH-quinone oxidoreductase subunit [Phycisphaerales bacterium]